MVGTATHSFDMHDDAATSITRVLPAVFTALCTHVYRCIQSVPFIFSMSGTVCNVAVRMSITDSRKKILFKQSKP